MPMVHKFRTELTIYEHWKTCRSSSKRIMMGGGITDRQKEKRSWKWTGGLDNKSQGTLNWIVMALQTLSGWQKERHSRRSNREWKTNRETKEEGAEWQGPHTQLIRFYRSGWCQRVSGPCYGLEVSKTLNVFTGHVFFCCSGHLPAAVNDKWNWNRSSNCKSVLKIGQIVALIIIAMSRWKVAWYSQEKIHWNEGKNSTVSH